MGAIKAWDELAVLYEACSEADGLYTHASYEANKPTSKKLYERMVELNEQGLIEDGWEKTGTRSWKKKNAISITLP
jgi:hypothetical protein